MVRVQLAGTDAAEPGRGAGLGRPGTPDQWPVAISGVMGHSTLAGGSAATSGVTSTIPGQVYMTWTLDSIYASSGGLNTFFNTMASEDQSYLEGSGISRSLEVGMEVKKEGKATPGRDAGIGRETTYASGTTWGTEVEFGAQVSAVTGPESMSYHWAPYIWMQEVVPPQGGTDKLPDGGLPRHRRQPHVSATHRGGVRASPWRRGGSHPPGPTGEQPHPPRPGGLEQQQRRHLHLGPAARRYRGRRRLRVGPGPRARHRPTGFAAGRPRPRPTITSEMASGTCTCGR